jgi:tRNA (guanine-N7-)-methyltransferase
LISFTHLFPNPPNPTLPSSTTDTVQIPDPHIKAQHRKRRMVQPALVAAMCASLKPEGGEILIQSDVQEVAESMREAFSEDELVSDVCPPGEWMEENPLKVPTEREKLTLGRGDPVYRTVFRRKESS